jgi:glycerol-3-phosphate O-acyltransferase
MSLFGVDRGRLRMLARLFGLWVRPTLLPLEVAEHLRGRSRRMVYVLEWRALSDLLALQIACTRHGLPAPARVIMIGALRLPRAALDLGRPAGVLGRRRERRVPAAFAALIASAGTGAAADVDLIPVTVLWGRAPGRAGSSPRLFSADPATQWRLRRFFSTLVNGRHTLVHLGEPQPVAALAAAGADREQTLRLAARRLRLQIRHARTGIVGPKLSQRRTIIQEVLRGHTVRAAARALARHRGISRRAALGLARRYANEIAADYSSRFVFLMAALLRRPLNRLYAGIEIRHAERLASVEPGAQLVYLPCHRSHMDYVLLSYVLYRRGLAVPHIAAGVNLNLPVIGRLLRMGGAFFVRRGFRGDALYPAVFTQYLAVMTARGHALEYFVEGGRSRTGRLLAPKTGLLSMTVRSYLVDRRRPVWLMPVFIAYERLMEAQTYVGELSGEPKEEESVLGLVRALPKLFQRFGRVYLCFGTPLSLAEQLAPYAPAAGAAQPGHVAAAVAALGTTVQQEVNAAAFASPVALLALVLLATPRQAMAEADLVRQLDLCRRLLELAPYSDASGATPDGGAAIVEYGIGFGLIRREQHPLGPVIRMPEKLALLSAYYRNNVLHLYALPSLIACAFLNNETMTEADIQRLVWRIYPYVAQELYLRYREPEVPAVVIRLLGVFAQLGLLSAAAGERAWRRPPAGSAEAVQLSLLGQFALAVIERYYLAIALLIAAGPDRITQEALELRCSQMASRMALIYQLQSPEFFDRALFRSFLDLLRSRAVIATDGEGRLGFDDELLRVASDARVVLSEQIRHSILQVTHA